jgi:hypothetical protein
MNRRTPPKQEPRKLREHPGEPIPLAQWNDFYAWPPPGGLRHLRFHDKSNGFADAFIQCGRRILIDPVKFWEIVKNQGGKSCSSSVTPDAFASSRKGGSVPSHRRRARTGSGS